MLIMPQIHRRPVERLKSSRSISVHRTERSRPVDQHQTPPAQERRLVRERRRKSVPVPVERRRNDRRLARLRAKPEVRAMLENSGQDGDSREGRFINEEV